MAIEFSEGFEQGTLGAKVTSELTDFWSVYYDNLDGVEWVLVEFSDDAYRGNFSATVPVESVALNSDETQEMMIIGSSPDGLIIDEPVDITWFYKFESGTLPFFGRYVWEAQFDVLGTPVLSDYNSSPPPWMYPDTNHHTHLYLGLEHSNLDPGDDPDGMYYYHQNSFADLYEPELPPFDVVEPQFPRGTWLKMRFTWQGAGLPFTMKCTDADDESTVHMDVTHTAPEGIGFSNWTFRPQTYNYSDPGYVFQNWFDGGVEPAIIGDPIVVRRRFT